MRFPRWIFMNDNSKKFVFLHTCYEGIIYENFISQELICLRRGWKMMNLDLVGWTVSLLAFNKPRRKRELYIKNGC